MSGIGNLGCFTEVDRSDDPSFFVRFLDAANILPSVRAGKATLLEHLDLRQGQSVVDVGCGTGEDALALARVVGSDGRVVGVDLSHVLIAEARIRSRGCDLAVEYDVGDSQALPFGDDTFDACRADRLLMHVRDVDRALREMVRVTRVGGRLAVLDLDFDTLVVDSADRDTTRVVVRSIGDRIRHGWIGRQLPRMFAERGLIDVRVTAHTVLFDCEFLSLLAAGPLHDLRASGALRPDELTHWWQGLLDAQQTGTFFAAITAFIVAATKP